jgi:amino acid transporter
MAAQAGWRKDRAFAGVSGEHGGVAVPKKLTLAPLLAATYFMVAGGPYGLEDLLRKCGYRTAVVVLLLTPILWSLPSVLMVGELASTLPAEGGYYVWVKRALGPFWGFQEAWLSLCASIFDMAIYPTLFVLYLGRLWPGLADGPGAVLTGMAVIAVCAAANLRGARAVGGASEWMGALLLAPFVVFCVMAFSAHPQASLAPASEGRGSDLVGGLLVAMWNFMGWDNASTVAGEVERPQRTYPRAMLGAMVLVVLTYLAPVLAAARTGLEPEAWSTGSWVAAAETVGGPLLAMAMVVGGMVCGLGMMDALVMSYSRLPMVMAQDGLLPRLFARQIPNTGAPWASVVVLSLAWCAALGLGFERLVELDVILYGLALLLEFVALIALRVREPNLPRPFRVPGGIPGVVALGAGPAVLLLLALLHEWQARTGRGGPIILGAGVVLAGPLLYLAAARARRRA